MMKRLMLVASMALIAAAVMAAPALASGVKWSATGQSVMGIKGTLTLKKNGGSAVTCALTATGEPKNLETGGHWAAGYALGIGNNVNTFNWMTKCSNGGTFEYNAWGRGLRRGTGQILDQRLSGIFQSRPITLGRHLRTLWGTRIPVRQRVGKQLFVRQLQRNGDRHHRSGTGDYRHWKTRNLQQENADGAHSRQSVGTPPRNTESAPPFRWEGRSARAFIAPLVVAALLAIGTHPARAAECAGDECQGPPPAPAEIVPGTAIVEGPENPPVHFPKTHRPKKPKPGHPKKHGKKHPGQRQPEARG